MEVAPGIQQVQAGSGRCDPGKALEEYRMTVIGMRKGDAVAVWVVWWTMMSTGYGGGIRQGM
jgi:hypothetical protein